MTKLFGVVMLGFCVANAALAVAGPFPLMMPLHVVGANVSGWAAARMLFATPADLDD